MNELNPNWVKAPYQVDFLFWVPGPPANWSRRRRLKWSRRKGKSEIKKFVACPPLHDIDTVIWKPIKLVLQ